MKKIKVPLKDRSYSIEVGRGLLEVLPQRLKALLPSKRVVVVTNTSIARLYKKKIHSLLSGSFEVSWVVVPDGEKYKNISTLGRIYQELARAKVDRKTALVALGGGVVGDMGGYAAASYLRGIPFVQVPTTLLAQVDSSVGGKTAIDLPEGKNLVGAFYQPKYVLIDTDFLKTLPQREFLCGLAEVVKYGVLWDGKFFSSLEKNRGKILSLDHAALASIISRSCAIKAKIVSEDEHEKGVRSLLNLGHTLGHAIETLSGYEKFHHGEAVSCGMVYAARLSHRLGFCSGEVEAAVTHLLKSLGLPTQWPSYPPQAYQKVMSLDKKADGAKINYVLIEKIGKTFTKLLTPKEATQCLL